MDGSYIAEWKLLAALARARDDLRIIRSGLWERALLPTTEHLHIDRVDVTEAGGWRPSPDGLTLLIEIAIVMKVPDGHDVTSAIEVLVKPEGWQVTGEVTALNSAVVVLWQGSASTGNSAEELEAALQSAVAQLVTQTLELNLQESHPSDDTAAR